jgi:hypothetical protein
VTPSFVAEARPARNLQKAREMAELKNDLTNHASCDETASEQSKNCETKKRPADTTEVEEESNAKRAREDEGRKVTVSGLKGMGQEFVQNHLDRAGLPYLKAWKQRKQDTATVWFPDDPVILRVKMILVFDVTMTTNMTFTLHRDHICYLTHRD